MQLGLRVMFPHQRLMCSRMLALLEQNLKEKVGLSKIRNLSGGQFSFVRCIRVGPRNLPYVEPSRTTLLPLQRFREGERLASTFSELPSTASKLRLLDRAKQDCASCQRLFSTLSALPSSSASRLQLHGGVKVKQECLTLSGRPSPDDGFKYGHSVVPGRCLSRKTFTFPVLAEADLEEDFVRGSGPGGQAVNKTANCVVLKHTPTGIVVKCHETRSCEMNRQRARERLVERVDLHYNGSNSYLALCEQETSMKRKELKKKNRSRLEMKKAFKEREGLE